ncbi:MAG: hypothetical protein SV062_01465, partial [Thermodesulfobacteriota bacterium]|nr:hypothetical protein [Thermodesulfobacteriota bacterium]
SQIIHRIDTKTNLIGGLWFQACVDDHLSGHSSLLQMSPSGNNDPSVTYEKFTIKCLLREAR